MLSLLGLSINDAQQFPSRKQSLSGGAVINGHCEGTDSFSHRLLSWRGSMCLWVSSIGSVLSVPSPPALRRLCRDGRRTSHIAPAGMNFLSTRGSMWRGPLRQRHCQPKGCQAWHGPISWVLADARPPLPARSIFWLLACLERGRSTVLS